MHMVPGYKITAQVYESLNSLVYRGISEADSQPVILKILKEDYPSREELIRYRQEYEITRNLAVPGVVKTYGQKKYGNTLIIILEDFGGHSLKILAGQRAFTLEESLSLAIRISAILGEIHGVRVIHKDINPANIVYNSEQDELKVIDFGISSRLAEENPVLKNPERMEGTLAYMSPEQTGRMNRPVDYRTDFYALGATLYELFTGQALFHADDPMELVHCHLAREPESPHNINPEISENLSQVVLKLLSKRPEDRYQTALGLKMDLEYCLEELQERGAEGKSKSLPTGHRKDFKPGERDFSNRFQLPQRLYGREEELKILLEAAERATGGGSESLFLSGYSGIGKSALVKEIYKPLSARRGYFIAGKFDQYHRNIPYSAVRTAFRELTRLLLTESEEHLAVWVDKMHSALGPNGRVMTEFLPELEFILGEQPPLPELGLLESRNRFTLVLQNFIKVFCQKEHPLVIFLDDLQWADVASLALMEPLMSGGNHLFLIGAYRDNEVPPTHPLQTTLDEMKETAIPVSIIALRPLDGAQVRNYVAEATRRSPDEADELATLIKQKTDGNPFFTGEFLKNLHREKLLQFEPASGSWSWDISQVREQGISENVVQLMSQRIKNLEKDTREVLMEAACLGNHFDLKTLSIILEKSPEEIARNLWPALSQGLIIPQNDAYKVASLDPLDMKEGELAVYSFAHDRIQEGAYSQVDAKEKKAIHLKIGRLLLENISDKERLLKVFDIVDHLNTGEELMGEQSERDELALLNLQAGEKAQSSIAYEPALRYYQFGLKALGEGGWERNYTLTFELATQGAKAAYLTGNYTLTEELVERALKRANSLGDRVNAEEIRLLAFHSQNAHLEALKTGIVLLRKLGVRLHENPGGAHINRALMLTGMRLAGKSSEHICNLPEMTDPSAISAIRILNAIVVPAYMSAPALFPVIISKMIQLSLKSGNSGESSYAYVMYGLILNSGENIEEGYKFGRIALKLLEKKGFEKFRPRVMLIYYTFISVWKEQIADSVSPLQAAFQISLETGDQEYAVYAAVNFSYLAHLSGKELSSLEKQMTTYADQVVGFGQKAAFTYLNIWRQATRNLIEVTENPTLLAGEAYDEETMLPVQEEAHDTNGIFAVLFAKLELACIFRNFDEARQLALKVEPMLPMAPGNPAKAQYYFYDSLTLLDTYSEKDEVEQTRIRERVVENQDKMKTWAEYAPSNQEHRYYLVAAEEARLQGQPLEARGLYEKSIDLARKYNHLNEEAFIWEFAGRFYLENSLQDFTRLAFRNAHYLYSRWGAAAKVQQLEQSFPDLFTSQRNASWKEDSFTKDFDKSTDGRFSGSLDLNTIIKASQAISGETELEKLLRKLMRVLLENAGARRGLLLLNRDGRWLLEAEGYADQKEMKVLQGLPMEDSNLPLTLINYVIRTREKVVLEHAVSSGPFVSDPYIQKNKARSILCIPLTHQGQLVGMIYLGNNLTEGAFTQARLKVVEILSAQISISIRNALAQETERARITAEAANKAKSDFLASMSHELRTPLNGILGYAQILGLSSNLNVREKEGVGIIKGSGDHLLHLIDEILDLSKIEADKLELNPLELHFSRFLDHTVELFRIQAEQKELVFDYQELTPLPKVILADEKRLKQILFNLLGNALRYTNEGKITFRVAYEKNKLTFGVKDTGVGIAEEDLGKIFQPFRQVGEGERIQGSSGLGLSICKKLVELMQGRLCVSSVLGEGSDFSFEVSLPESILSEKGFSVQKRITGYQGTRRKILIGDDIQSSRRLLRDLLSPLGFELEEAKDGRDALAKARESNPDLILLDSAMPIMDGLTCIREIRKDPKIKTTCIVTLSARVMEADRKASLEAGADEFLTKPVDVEGLLLSLGGQLGLEWEYDTSEAGPESQEGANEIIGPPSKYAQKIFQAAKSGDIGNVLELAQELNLMDAGLVPFTREVQRLANAFQERKLQEFLKKYVVSKV